MNPENAGLSDFSGEVSLFPLPNLVLFPHVVQPLHIFEARYRQMVADSLASDRLLSMALLCHNAEKHPGTLPRIHPVICVGRIFREERLPDGRFNLLLHGVSRARIIQELPSSGKLYRRASVELLEEVPAASKEVEESLRGSLLQQIDSWFGGQPEARSQIRKLFKSELPLGSLCDILAFALPLDAELKQELLELVDIEERGQLLLTSLRENKETLAESASSKRKFPPDFGTN